MSALSLALVTLLASSVMASSWRPEIAQRAIERRAKTDVQLFKRFSNSRWSFYDVGLGACGRVNVESDFIVALNAEQFGSGYPGPNCFQSITMSYNGKTATARIMDRCPGCPYGGLDLSRSLFRHFDIEDKGIIYGEWHFGNGEATAPAPAPTTTTRAAITTSRAPTPVPTTSRAPAPGPTTTQRRPAPALTTTQHPVPASSSSSSSSTQRVTTPTPSPSPSPSPRPVTTSSTTGRVVTSSATPSSGASSTSTSASAPSATTTSIIIGGTDFGSVESFGELFIKLATMLISALKEAHGITDDAPASPSSSRAVSSPATLTSAVSSARFTTTL